MKREEVRRERIDVQGRVQGVGFRPFVYRLARQLELAGWVSNTATGVSIEVEGDEQALEVFVRRLTSEAPSGVSMDRVERRMVAACHEAQFAIRPNVEAGRRDLGIMPDWAACDACLQEVSDPRDRRYHYPFTTCAYCGPRYSLITGMPYDRQQTTMSGFQLCSVCRSEYETEDNRRFHAESIACRRCGPQAVLWDDHGRELDRDDEALRAAAAFLRAGLIVAVKGLGGFQLWVDAGSEAAVRRLRARKRRPDKPFAVLFPSVDAVRISCLLSQEEERLLTSPRAPILLLRKRGDSPVAEAVAPGNPSIGALLPTTPLHRLLMDVLERPMVATSGNRSEEPIVTDEREALVRLEGIADAFLVHNRPIARPVDDSVVRVWFDGGDREEGGLNWAGTANVVILRRARGYVPDPIRLPVRSKVGWGRDPVLALGGQLKNTVALLRDDRVWLSQHLGDLSTLESELAFRQAAWDLARLLDVEPRLIACDLHPDYRSTVFAQELASAWSVPMVPVQHHHAHVVSCLAEHGLEGDVLGVAWDGSGYGIDGQLWGGECLVASEGRFHRFAHLWPFRLPGGEAAMREPKRSAAAVLWETMRERMAEELLPSWEMTREERERLASLLISGVASPWTTSMGRLFDAVASLTGLCRKASFEGQAAMAVEWAAERGLSGEDGRRASYPFALLNAGTEEGALLIDWRPALAALVEDLRRGMGPEVIGARFHLGLAETIVRVAQAAGLARVVLSGGCFQNVLLLALARRALDEAGFTVLWHREVPPNDGGLSLGQAVIAASGHTGRP